MGNEEQGGNKEIKGAWASASLIFNPNPFSVHLLPTFAHLFPISIHLTLPRN